MRKIIAAIFCLIPLFIAGQEDTVFLFSLDSAVEYAITNNKELQKNKMDIIKSKKKVWETTAAGLPQIDASGSYSYWLTVPESIEQFSSLGSFGSSFQDIYSQLGYFYESAQLNPPPDYQEPDMSSGEELMSSGEGSSTDDMRHNITLDISVSQLIFSGSYFVGLQAAKVYKSLSELSYESSTYTVKESVTNSYYLVLIMEANRKVLHESLENNKQIYNEYKSLYKNGLVEKTDVDQFKLVMRSLENNLRHIERKVVDSRRLLKYQMGLSLNDSLVLANKLDEMVEDFTLAYGLKNFDVEENSDYRLLEKQERVSELNVKLKRSEALPTISAYYNHQENFNDNSFTFTPPDVVGVNVSIPIFSSFERVAKINQAKIELKQSRLSKEYAKEGLIMKYESSKTAYINSYYNYITEKENRDLAYTIYKNNLKKYNEGIITSIELTQAQNQYLNSQSSYFNSIVELVSAKAEIDKLLNN